MVMIIHPGAKGFYIRNYWHVTIFAFLLFCGASIAFFSGVDLWIPAAAVLLAIILLVIGWAHALFNSTHTSMTLDGMEVIYQTGIINRRIITVAVNQITDSAISQDLLDKILGTATLKINTSGSSDYEVEDGGFRFTEAKEMHDAVYALIDKKKSEKPSKDFE